MHEILKSPEFVRLNQTSLNVSNEIKHFDVVDARRRRLTLRVVEFQSFIILKLFSISYKFLSKKKDDNEVTLKK